MRLLPIIFCLISINSFSQKVVNNILLFDIDDIIENDNFMSLAKMKIKETFEIGSQKNSVAGEVLTRIETFDEKGYRTKLTKLNGTQKEKVDYTITFNKVSDTLYESTITYPAGSLMIDDHFTYDTIIAGEQRKMCLYKKDKSNNIFVRSLYSLNQYGQIILIKRYDCSNKLQQLFYPLGSRKPKIETSDSVMTDFGKQTIYKAEYEENVFKSISAFNKKNQLVEYSYYNTSRNDSGMSAVRQFITYSKNSELPIFRNTVDENNVFISEERFYYEDGLRVKYTRDEDLLDADLNEERIYNIKGQLLRSTNKGKYSGNTTIWIYKYDQNGLMTGKEYLVNNKVDYYCRFEYK